RDVDGARGIGTCEGIRRGEFGQRVRLRFLRELDAGYVLGCMGSQRLDDAWPVRVWHDQQPEQDDTNDDVADHACFFALRGHESVGGEAARPCAAERDSVTHGARATDITPS